MRSVSIVASLFLATLTATELVAARPSDDFYTSKLGRSLARHHNGKRTAKCKAKHHGSSTSGGQVKVINAAGKKAEEAAPTASKAEVVAPAATEGSKADTSSSPVSGAGLFSFVDNKCGKSGATEDVTKKSGPNGSMDFLNCGLYGGGWTPPDVHIDQVSALSLDETIEEPNSPFSACKPFVHLFDKYGAETGLPAILLASLAMQESSCRKDAMGDNGGAYGLMQITAEKCSEGIDCTDPDYNIKTGAYYFKNRLDENNGNVLLALGQYNGWYAGLTVAKATAVKGQCCQCQNNLNYFQQMLNGWLQGKDGSTLGDWNMGC